MTELTIDQLAREVGMTVRNVRAHQTRGLLPAPEVKGRTGYYGPEHIARLQLIREMQGAGFNLEAIKRVLEMAPSGSGEELLRFERLLMAPWEEEDSEFTDLEELSRRFGGVNEKAMSKAISLGILKDLGDGRIEVLSPSLLRAGEEVVSLGIPLDHALSVTEKVQRHARAVAREFVRLFLQDVWRPFERSGTPEEQLPAIRESLEKLRALSSDVLMAAFGSGMSEEVESAFGKELGRSRKTDRKVPVPRRRGRGRD